MTLTYFVARSGSVAYPRSKVSVYRTIGPLVIDSVRKGSRANVTMNLQTPVMNNQEMPEAYACKIRIN